MRLAHLPPVETLIAFHGIEAAVVDYRVVTYDINEITVAIIVRLIEKLGYQVIERNKRNLENMMIQSEKQCCGGCCS